MKNKELLFSITKKDFIVEPYKGSGKGGQHRNKTMSCVRIKHPESGAMAQACEDRDQRRNRYVAFKRLVNSKVFKIWLKKKEHDCVLDKNFLDKQVNKEMESDNIKIEYGPFDD